MNIGKRFWTMDNTDINRMFPGNVNGETTEKIASGIFEQVKEYAFGIQFASFYMPGDFIPHIRMMETGYHSPSLANLFGFQSVRSTSWPSKWAATWPPAPAPWCIATSCWS